MGVEPSQSFEQPFVEHRVRQIPAPVAAYSGIQVSETISLSLFQF